MITVRRYGEAPYPRIFFLIKIDYTDGVTTRKHLLSHRLTERRSSSDPSAVRGWLFSREAATR